jgi:hypothetical protein
MILLTTEVFLSVLNPHFPQKVREKILEVYAPVLNKYLDPFKLVEQIVFQGAFLELGGRRYVYKILQNLYDQVETLELKFFSPYQDDQERCRKQFARALKCQKAIYYEENHKGLMWLFW